MAKITLPNFLYSFKTIKKSALSISYIALFTCSVQASSNICDLAENLIHDVTKYATRIVRQEPSNSLDRTLQNFEDTLEDIQDELERKVGQPIKNWMKKHLK